MRGLAPLVVTAFALTACDAPPPATTTDETFPTITIGLGAKRIALRFGQVECTSQGSQNTVQLRALSSGDDAPALLLARWEGAVVRDAHVWIPEGALGHATELPWVQLVAAPVDGARKPDCRIETDGTAYTVVCNDATVVPWTEAGPVPDASFKTTFTCS